MIKADGMVCKNLSWFYTPGATVRKMADNPKYETYKRLKGGELSLLCILKQEGLRPFVLVTWTTTQETKEAKEKFNDLMARLIVGGEING
jgi:hypothetical protein